jgi:hypothetical protein
MFLQAEPRRLDAEHLRDLLGHASITTERYDNQTLEHLQAAAAKLEAGKTFQAPTSADSATDFQLSFKKTRSGGVKPRADKLTRRQANPLSGEEFEDWLGGRDSCPLPASHRRAGARLKPGRAANEASRR